MTDSFSNPKPDLREWGQKQPTLYRGPGADTGRAQGKTPGLAGQPVWGMRLCARICRGSCCACGCIPAQPGRPSALRSTIRQTWGWLAARAALLGKPVNAGEAVSQTKRYHSSSSPNGSKSHPGCFREQRRIDPIWIGTPAFPARFLDRHRIRDGHPAGAGRPFPGMSRDTCGPD